MKARSIDSTWIIAFILISGLAALFYWLAWLANEESTPIPETATATQEATHTPSPTLTLTFTPTATATLTPTRHPTETETATATNTSTATVTLTETPYPEPDVNPIVLADKYAGEPIAISGLAQPNDLVILLNNAAEFSQVQADPSGKWEINLDEGLEAGSHRLELYAVGAGGGESPIVPLGFIVSDAPTATPTPTFTPTFTFTATFTPTFTFTPTSTPSATPTPSFTATATFTATSSLVPTEISLLANETPSLVPTETPLPASETPSLVPTEISLLASETPSLLPSLTSTPNENLLPVTATHTLSPTPSATFTPSPTFSPVPPSPSPEIFASATEIVIRALTIPRFDTPQNPYSPFAPIIISGRSEANTIVTLSRNGEILGEVQSDSDGFWRFVWETGTQSSVIQAIASDLLGRSSPAARANFAVEATAPRITSGRRTITPATPLSIEGRAPAFAPIILRSQRLELGSTLADAEGTWAIPLSLSDVGVYDLQAFILDETGLSSNILRITVAETLAPATGGLPNDANQIYTLLLALLLILGGIWLILAVRLVYRRVR